MQIILLAAAVINLVVTGDVGTSVVLAGLTVFNAVVGLRQEAKAEESVKALAQMMKTIARVRRGGQAIEVDAEELVPGDVVLMEAGNRVPADGRICVAATLEIEEAALTGESLPVAKSTDPVSGDDVPLGDRTCLAYMNTSVTRGRGEMIVTATGMDTEIGHIANLLATTEADKTPLQKQLDGLSKIIATIAGIALVLVVILGLVRGQSFDTLFITGVALAVAAIPTGLPAVVTALLSIGTREIARRLPADRRGAVRLGLQVHGHLPRDARRRRPAGRPLLCQGRPGRADRPGRLLPGPRRHRGGRHRRQSPSGHRRQRPHGRLGGACDGGGPARPGQGVLRPRGDLLGLVRDLTLLAMVGIVDPPRAEAKAAIAECRGAGIRVRMITGDHATTAAAIARELGIEGRAVTGAEFAAMSDDQLVEQLPEIGVVARVAPEDKLRLVRLLKRTGNVAAMTGDGVNDAPALKAADIGVAMGITGTEVSKEAAVMILTDDNFATIVNAVEYGQALYDNLLKYLRF
jgi:magnesium-transporting ATPase (P-type)